MHTQVESLVVAILKERWVELLNEGLPEFDSRFIPLLTRLNAVDGFATMYHCSGHTESEHPGTVGITQSYLTFVHCSDIMDERISRMLRFIERIGTRRAAIANRGMRYGWEFHSGAGVIVPWYHYPTTTEVASRKFIKVDNGHSVRLTINLVDDPTCELLKQWWEEVFDVFIINPRDDAEAIVSASKNPLYAKYTALI